MLLLEDQEVTGSAGSDVSLRREIQPVDPVSFVPLNPKHIHIAEALDIRLHSLDELTDISVTRPYRVV